MLRQNALNVHSNGMQLANIHQHNMFTQTLHIPLNLYCLKFILYLLYVDTSEVDSEYTTCKFGSTVNLDGADFPTHQLYCIPVMYCVAQQT